jgi:hypothetical protein
MLLDSRMALGLVDKEWREGEVEMFVVRVGRVVSVWYGMWLGRGKLDWKLGWSVTQSNTGRQRANDPGRVGV